MISVDLNCDMGESWNERIIGDDAAIMPYITSANIACGYHGGNPSVMNNTVKLAQKWQVSIGAHPSFNDLNGFGRQEFALGVDEITHLIIYQVGALQGFAKANGSQLTHVKPHGALYNLAARNRHYADAIANAMVSLDPDLILFGLSGSELIHAGDAAGLKTCSEVFADRSYRDDGSLTPRSEPGAMIADPEIALEQVLDMVTKGKVRSIAGNWIDIKAETICIHGDTEGAAAYARIIREGLISRGITIRSVKRRDEKII
jgi:UPF0271 protein